MRTADGAPSAPEVEAGAATTVAAPRVELVMEAVDRMAPLRWAATLYLVGAVVLGIVGVPGVDVHGPLHRIGIMDPFCGGTRATFALARGNVAAAWSWNPLVPFLGLGALAVMVRDVIGRVRGRWLNLVVPRAWALGVASVVLAVVEVNQQLQAQRLIGR